MCPTAPGMLTMQVGEGIKTHTKPYWIRLPSRLPPALLIWFIGRRPLLASAETCMNLVIATDSNCLGSMHPLGLFAIWYGMSPPAAVLLPFYSLVNSFFAALIGVMRCVLMYFLQS
jgi:hypothetical protein